MTAEEHSKLPVGVRLAWVERDVKSVLSTVLEIDKALRFPENSALGRQLLERAQRNADGISELRGALDAHREQGRQNVQKVRDELNGHADKVSARLDAVEDRVTELNGVAKALRIASVLVGILAGLFTLFQLVRPPV